MKHGRNCNPKKMRHVSWCPRGEMHDYDEKQKRNLAGNADWVRDACRLPIQNCPFGAQMFM